MNKVHLMHLRQSSQKRNAFGDQVFPVKMPVSLDEFLQRNTIQELHDNVGCIICFKVVMNLNDSRDVFAAFHCPGFFKIPILPFCKESRIPAA